MPRKRANNQEPPRKRSRAGCNKCRTRKVRCDEQKPACSQCLAKGFACETTLTLKWEQDYTNAGRAFGRTGLWSKRPADPDAPSSPCVHITDQNIPWCRIPIISAYSFINATLSNVAELTTLDATNGPDTSHALDVVRTNDRDDASSTASLSPWMSKRQPVFFPAYRSIPSSPSTLPHLQDPIHSNLLSYYLEKICPITVPSSVSKSPFANLILPFSITSSPAVLNALLALAACHRSKSDAVFRSTALQLGDKVLRSLRTRLTTEDPQQVALDPEVLVTMMILCQYEIINECDKRWVVHLKGARDLIRIRRNAQHLLTYEQTNELVDFTEKYFAFQDVIGRTACGEEPIFGSDFWTSQGEETDAWLGCSAGLVSILCEITELSRQHRADPTVSLLRDFQYQAASLERRLCGLKQRVFDEDDDILQMSAELKRFAAELYLHCALNGATPAMPLVIGHVRQIFRLISVLLEHNVLAGLSWPIFVAAVELEPTEDFAWTDSEDVSDGVPHHARPFVLYALDRLTGSIANVTKTRSIIEKIWQTRELSEFSEPQLSGQTRGHNDWERYVAPLCGGLSLA